MAAESLKNFRFLICEFGLGAGLVGIGPIESPQSKIKNARDPLNLIRLTPSKGETAKRDRSILF